MEHRCYKCGAPVEDGVPFCPECRAPQIRVAVDEPATPPLEPGTPEGMQPPAQPVPLEHELHWRDALPASAAAAVLIFVAMFPVVAILIAMFAGGALSVALYARRRPQTALTAGTGARIGAMSGVMAFLFTVVIMIAAGGSAVRSAIQQMVQNLAQQGNPAAQEMLRQLEAPGVIGTFMMIMIVVMFVFTVGLSSIGGMIGCRLLRRGRR